jgi:acetate kinase
MLLAGGARRGHDDAAGSARSALRRIPGLRTMCAHDRTRAPPAGRRTDDQERALSPLGQPRSMNKKAIDITSSAATAELLKRRVGLFEDFSDERLRRLVSGSRVASFERNEAVAHEGDETASFGIVMNGTVVASVDGGAGTPRILGRLHAGDTLGELSLMSGESQLADFIAETPCAVLWIPISLFQSLIVSEPSAARRLARTISDRVQALASDPERAAAALRMARDPYGLELKTDRAETILVVNCGSSSLKYSFYDTADSSRNARGVVEKIGIEGTRLVHHGPKGESKRELAKTDGARAGSEDIFAPAFAAMVDALASKSTGVLGADERVGVVAHRVVHGGERFTEATLVTDDVLAEIERLNPLAPLHNPVNLAGIRAMLRLFPDAAHVAVFDTSFHHTLSPYAYLYGLPYELYENRGVRRYGFHGASHHYVSLRAAQFLKRRPNELRLVTCHLGNGSSLCAVDHGRSVDTTMGFTPVEGLIMGTRSGDVDAGILTYLERADGLTPAQCEELLNKKSGLLGISGVSSDMREILAAAGDGEHRALLALKAYCYRVRKYIGAYVAAMGGLDAVVFTGGVGQGSTEVRALSLQGLACMGIALDEERNRSARGFDEICRISKDESSVEVLVVPTDEERMMAREALRAVHRSAVARELATRKQEPFAIEISPRHVHLTREHVEKLFGKGRRLTKESDRSQPGQFACRERVAVVGPKGRLEGVQVFGPERDRTQVELAMTEEFALGVHPPIRESGDIQGTPGCTLEGPAGSVTIERGIICAMRLLHMTPEDALRYGLRDKSVVRVRVLGEREHTFGDVLVRVGPSSALALKIDTDEARAADVRPGARAVIEAVQGEG